VHGVGCGFLSPLPLELIPTPCLNSRKPFEVG
jgi:hypothetical protein